MTVASMVHKLMPARQTPVRIVADFDSLVSEPIGFILFGKQYRINPVTTETFMRFADSFGSIQGLIKLHAEKGVTTEEAYEKYFNLISILCPQITIPDLQRMSMPQMNALVALIVKHVSGEIQSPDQDGEKKKT